MLTSRQAVPSSIPSACRRNAVDVRLDDSCAQEQAHRLPTPGVTGDGPTVMVDPAAETWDRGEHDVEVVHDAVQVVHSYPPDVGVPGMWSIAP